LPQKPKQNGKTMPYKRHKSNGVGILTAQHAIQEKEKQKKTNRQEEDTMKSQGANVALEARAKLKEATKLSKKTAQAEAKSKQGSAKAKKVKGGVVPSHHVPKDTFGCRHSGIYLDKMRTFDATEAKKYLKAGMWLDGRDCVKCETRIAGVLAAHQEKEAVYKAMSPEVKKTTDKPIPFKLRYCDKGCGAHNKENDEENACDHVYCTPCFDSQVEAYIKQRGQIDETAGKPRYTKRAHGLVVQL
jgi:hypothetical protein